MPRRPLDPIRLPPRFWQSPECLQVLANRDVPQLIRMVQHEANASQTQIGIAIGMSQPQVSEILSGARRVVSIDVLNRIAEGFGMPDLAIATFLRARILDINQHVRPEDRETLSPAPEPVTPAVRPLSHEPPQVPGTLGLSSQTDWAGMLRRTFITGPAAMATLQLVNAFTPHRDDRPLDPDIVHGMMAVSAQYRRAYQAVPASRLLPAAAAHLDLILSLRPAQRPDSERVPLITAAGEMAVLTGVLLALDAARHIDALSSFDLAWSAARAVSDLELMTVVLASRSFAVAYGNGDHRAGLEAADHASTIGKSGASPQTRAWAAAVASERAASLGDLAECQSRLEESRLALDSVDYDGVQWRGIGGYNTDKLTAYEGGDLVRLGRYSHANELLTTALARLDPSLPRHRATALLDRADARLGLGQIDAAVSDATDALALVTAVQHTSHLGRISAVATKGMNADIQPANDLHHQLQLVRIDIGLPSRSGRE
jgi:transcriptional regulator with XRE-family HTH domain/tetratricopeptide (TPR) repeat protein